MTAPLRYSIFLVWIYLPIAYFVARAYFAERERYWHRLGIAWTALAVLAFFAPFVVLWMLP